MTTHIVSAVIATARTSRRVGPLGRIAATCLLLLGAPVRPAEATAFSYSFVVDLADAFATQELDGRTGLAFHMPVDPLIDLSAGDTLHVDIVFAFDEALRVRDLAPLENERMDFAPIANFQRAADTSVALTFLGVSGSLLQNPILLQNTPIDLRTRFDGNLTDGEFAFTGVALDWTAENPLFPNIPVREFVSSFRLAIIADEVEAIGGARVPEPGSVVLLLLGLVGLRYRRSSD